MVEIDARQRRDLAASLTPFYCPTIHTGDAHDHHDDLHLLSDLLRGRLSRRRFIQGAAAGAAALTLAPFPALAAEGKYEAMVLACIDPRIQEGVRRTMLRRHLTGKYSQFIMAGAAIGVVAPAFKDWHKAFWDNLAASVQLHSIKKVIAIDHRDCGAAKIAYGADSVENARCRDRNSIAPCLPSSASRCNDKQPKLEGRNRPDGAQRQDRDVRLTRRALSRPATAASRRGPDRPRRG